MSKSLSFYITRFLGKKKRKRIPKELKIKIIGKFLKHTF
jgi:hypothetical protein